MRAAGPARDSSAVGETGTRAPVRTPRVDEETAGDRAGVPSGMRAAEEPWEREAREAGAPTAAAEELWERRALEADEDDLGPAPMTMTVQVEEERVEEGFAGLPDVVAREATQLYELLLAYGAAPGDARHKVTELYSPPRVTAMVGRLPRLGLLPGSTFDLRVGADGRTWDFRRRADRAAARRQIHRSASSW